MKSFQNKSESVTDGDVSGAEEALLTALGSYITATSSAVQIKRRGTVLTIATPFAGNVTLSGKPIKTVIISFSKSSNLVEKPMKRLNVVHARSSGSVRGSKRKSSKN